MRQWLSPPNLFTLARLVLVPFIIEAILRGEHFLALELFAAAAVTDLLDGALARRFGWITPAGAYLDPIADKTLLSGIYVALAVAGYVPVWFVALIFGRDILILGTSGAALYFSRIRAFSPSIWGKCSTFFQIVTAVAWMAQNVFPSPVFARAAEALIWPTAALTIWSGIHYAWRGLRLVRLLRTD